MNASVNLVSYLICKGFSRGEKHLCPLLTTISCRRAAVSVSQQLDDLAREHGTPDDDARSARPQHGPDWQEADVSRIVKAKKSFLNLHEAIATFSTDVPSLHADCCG